MPKDTTARQEARSLVLANLPALAADLLHWRRKGKLPVGSQMEAIAKLLEPECPADDSMQQAEYLVMTASLELAANPPPPASDVSSLVPRLDWASRTLRATADRSRKELGDGYPEVLQVLGAVNACLEVLGEPRPQ